MSKEIRTRFAPSPTGYMHIGNLRTALYEFLIAKNSGGKFILRIEDTDQERYVEGATDIIYSTMQQTGLVHDEGPDVGGDFGPYVQSERRDLYLPYAKELVKKGAAYYCFCTKERLDAVKAESEQAFSGYDRHCRDLSPEEVEANLKAGVPYVIRQKMPLTGKTSYTDTVYGLVEVENSELEDQVLIKSDGLPTYNFANVIDDHLMQITHVVRGNEYLSSTPKYNLLYDAFGWDKPTYIHLPPVMKDQQHKLSKRNGDASFQDLVTQGYLPEAIMNYIALLGWSPRDNQEFFTLQELIESFHIEGLSKSPAIFDKTKLTWMNGEYLRKMDPDRYYELALPYLQQAVQTEGVDLKKIATLVQGRADTFCDIAPLIDFIDALPEYNTDMYCHKKMKTDKVNSLENLKIVVGVLENIPEETWTEEVLHDALINLATQLGVKNGQIMWPVRTALSGKDVTPGGAIEILYLLGKEESLGRLDTGIDMLTE